MIVYHYCINIYYPHIHSSCFTILRNGFIYTSIYFTGGGVDYSSAPYNVTIPAGQISVPFDVTINDDIVFEENEEFLLTIDQCSSLNGVIIGSPNVTVVTILDNDGECDLEEK